MLLNKLRTREELAILGHEALRMFFVEKLAKTLWEHVDCDEPRQEIDWKIAEQHVAEKINSTFIESMKYHFIICRTGALASGNTESDLSDFELLELYLGGFIWEIGYQAVTRHLPSPYIGIKIG